MNYFEHFAFSEEVLYNLRGKNRMNKFEEFNLDNKLLHTINRLGFTEPTQIQRLSIPHVIKGKDVIGESATGSGKTLAFGCGIIERVVPKMGLQALILTPTRELAEQVKEELRRLSNNKLKIISIYGGVSINPQIEGLRRAEVVVATPGRLIDLVNREALDLSQVKTVILEKLLCNLLPQLSSWT